MYGPFNFYQGRLAGWVTFAGSPFSPKKTLSQSALLFRICHINRVPSIEVSVHDLCTPDRAKSVNTARTIVENWGVHRYIKLQNRENAFYLPHKPSLEDPLFAYS